MPIEKGQDWGRPGSLPDDAVNAPDDASIARAIDEGADHVRPTGGDLATTLGVSATSLARPAATLLPCDALAVELDGETVTAVANVVIGNPRRPDVIVLNAAFVGDWNVAPRAHPGDGRLDIVTFNLGLIDWFKAKRRLPTGSHVPHPSIKVRSAAQWEESFDSPRAVEVDRVPRGRVTSIAIRVIDEAVVAGV